MNNPQMEQEPSDKTVLISALGWVGVFLVFILVVAVAYLPNRAASQGEKDAEIRLQIRDEVDGDQTHLVNAYEWINRPEGVVRIPVDRAMKLLVEELRAEQRAKPDPSL